MCNIKEPKLDTEFGWSVFKGMFILLVFTNLLWACIHFGYVYKSFNGTSMEVMQDGAKADKALSAACYYESQHDAEEDKRY